MFSIHILLPRQTPSCRVQYTTPNPIVKVLMYAARRRQKSVRGKFQFGKLCIGQQFQLFDNPLRQFPQGGFVGHQVASVKRALTRRVRFVNRCFMGCSFRFSCCDCCAVKGFQPVCAVEGRMVILPSTTASSISCSRKYSIRIS
mgnify:CR=1 FL=1